MIEIQAPDGSTVQFPDGTDDATIVNVMRQNFGGPQGSPAPQVAPEAAPQKGFFQSAGETLRDSVDGVAQGASFNLADEAYGVVGTPFRMLANALTGEDSGKGLGQRVTDAYARSRDFARDRYKQAAERSPVATTVGEVGGGVTLGGTAAKGGLTLLNAAKPTYTSMIGRGAGEGAAYGAAYGFGAGEGGIENRLDSAMTGGALGAATGGTMGAVGARMAKGAANKTIPTTEVLKNQSNAAYKAADQAGVVLEPKSFTNAVDDIAAMAKQSGLDPTLHPRATGALARLDAAKGSQPTLSEVDTLRQIVGDAAGSPDRGERRLASKMIEKLDDYISNLKPTDVVSGDALKGASALNKARDLWSRKSRAELIENAVMKAERRAASTGSGGNADNAIRQNIRAILDGPKSRGFSKEERDIMEKIVRGGSVQNLARLVGKLSPSGNGLMAAMGLGATVANPAMAVVPAMGMGAKMMADRATGANVAQLSRIIRSGGQLPQVQMLPAQQRALLQSLLVTGSQQGQSALPKETGILSTFQ